MIQFKNIKIKNFLSIGEEVINLSLDSHAITLVSGENGTAKSAICVDSIYYALFGKSFRGINLNRLINSTNKKKLEVELDFHSNGNDYKIIRGMKPNRFEIYINGKLKEQLSTAKEYQNYLQNHILKIDEKTYKQIVVLGSTAYTSFMALPAADRRVIIEQLLNLNIFEYFVDYTKNEIKKIEDEKQRLDTKLSELNIKIQMYNKNKKSNIENYKKQIDEIKEKIEKTEQDKTNIILKIEEMTKSVDKDGYNIIIERKKKKQSIINEAKEIRGKLLSTKDNLAKTLKFFDKNNVCPTCNQSLDSDFIKHKIETITEEYNSYDDKINGIDSKLEEIYTAIDDYNRKIEKYDVVFKEINQLTNTSRLYSNNIEMYNNQIKTYQKRIEEEKNINIENISGLDSEISKINGDIELLNKKMNVLNFFVQEFKDSGVKTKIISSYIDIINRLIQKYLKIEGYEINFQFDEYFIENIGASGMENFEFNNLSEGERKRVDIAILFAFRDLSQIKSCVSTNILVLDEADSGTLDSEGFSSLINILKSCKNQNVFIISHSGIDFEEISDRHYEIKKIDGFSYAMEV